MEIFLKTMFPELAHSISSEARWIVVADGNTQHRFTYLDPAIAFLLNLRKKVVG